MPSPIPPALLGAYEKLDAQNRLRLKEEKEKEEKEAAAELQIARAKAVQAEDALAKAISERDGAQSKVKELMSLIQRLGEEKTMEDANNKVI